MDGDRAVIFRRIKRNLHYPDGHAWGPMQQHRYEWASSNCKGAVLDAACGPGLGTALLARKNLVVGVDLDPACIEFAARFSLPGPMGFIQGNIFDAPWKLDFEGFQTVISIETIEHVKDDLGLLKVFYDTIPAGGLLIGSVPNEEHYPFDPEKFKDDPSPHVRHYRPSEIAAVLEQAGFEVPVNGWASQHVEFREGGGKRNYQGIRPGPDGPFILFVARKC